MADYSMANWYRAQQAQNPYASMFNWGASAGGAPVAPVATPAVPMIGADYEQMPGQGMFAGSAVNAPIATTPNLATTPTAEGSWFSNLLRDNGITGYTNKDGIRTDGYGGLAVNAAMGMGNLYMGMKNYNLAKEAYDFNKQMTLTNLKNQTALTNQSMEDRQRARVASNSGAYQSVGDYMNQHRVG